MSSPFLPLPERREAIERLLDILFAADIESEESMTLCVLMASNILMSYRIAPGTAHWRSFFKMLAVACEAEMKTRETLSLPRH
jgi:hypothetical protein